MSNYQNIIIEKILNKVNDKDVSDCIVLLDYTNSVNVRFSLNHIISSGNLYSSSLTIVTFKDKKCGIYTTQDFDDSDEKLDVAINKSIELTQNSDDSYDYTDLVSSDEAGSKFNEMLPIEEVNAKAFSTISTGMDKIFDWAIKQDALSFGYISYDTSTLYLATSKGIKKSSYYNKSYISSTIKSKDFKNSLWKGVSGVELKDSHFEEIIDFFDSHWKYMDKKVNLPAGKYEVILTPTATADMLAYRHWLSDARSADEGRSMYSDANGKNKVGQMLVPKYITIYSDPNEKGISEFPFMATGGSSEIASVYDNGYKNEKTFWYKNGVLENLIYTRHWAKKQNISKYSLFQSNILMEGTDTSLDEMIKKTKKGLLLNALWYIRLVDPKTGLLTGLTRDGVFVIEDGEIIGVCNNFRWNVSPQEMLANTLEVGQSNISLSKEWGDEMIFTKTPPIRVKDWNMSSVSEAV